MSVNPRTAELSAAGVSIWLDDLSRERLRSGNLADLIATRNVVGVTSNPTIFAKALSNGAAYADQLAELAGSDVDTVVRALTTTDVRDACDLFEPIYRATDQVDGRVSIEVEPGLAMDTEATVVQAAELRQQVGRDNVLIKIPATRPGLAAIRRTIAAGISVNVTLIFSTQRYLEVIDAYLSGLEDAAEAGIDLSTIHSVASVFVSRIDTEVDKRLAAIGTPEATALFATAAIANARICHELYAEAFSTSRWDALSERGARVQRPLWASTGVKDPSLPDTRYVTDLVTRGVVNTMPDATLAAFADHGEVHGDTVVPFYAQAHETIDALHRVGIDFDDVFAVLEKEGVEKFITSWTELVSRVQGQLDQA